jgi:hypothetical protein
LSGQGERLHHLDVDGALDRDVMPRSKTPLDKALQHLSAAAIELEAAGLEHAL